MAWPSGDWGSLPIAGGLEAAYRADLEAADDPAAAAKALVIARKQNPHIEAFLRGRRQAPKRLPDSYSHGSEDEALCFAEPLVMAWKRYPDCQKWLATQVTP